MDSSPRPSKRPRPDDDDHNEDTYLVDYRWWQENEKDTDQVGLYNVTYNENDDSVIRLELTNVEVCDGTKEGFAMIGSAMWLQALKWHLDAQTTSDYAGRLFGTEETSQDIFPLTIRILVSWGTSSLTMKINRKDNFSEFYKRASRIFKSYSKRFHIWDLTGQTNQLLLTQVREVCLVLQVYDDTCFRVASPMPMTGLKNLGNTCYMNSAVQCLAHTPKLVDYFLGNFQKEINSENLLGTKGVLALAFGDLLRKLWTPGSKSVSPNVFKLELAKFAPRFSGNDQHDSQEFLAFLLDGLHEDLNRVKCKQYIEAKDVEGRPEVEVAEEYWKNHLANNDSIIVDLCLGQCRSSLVCTACSHLSVTFDPFLCLSLPLPLALPSTRMRSMSLMVFTCDGITLPIAYTISVQASGRLKNLIDALSTACSLTEHETLLVAEVYMNRILRLFEDPCDSLGSIGNEEKLVAYRLPRDDKTSKLIVYVHQRNDNRGKLNTGPETFGVPFVARVSDFYHELDIRQPFLKFFDTFDKVGKCDDEASIGNDVSGPKNLDTHFIFYLAEDWGATKGRLIETNQPLDISNSTDILNILVMWPETMLDGNDAYLMCSLSQLPESYFYVSKQEPDLYKCIESFLEEERLGPDNVRFCSKCQKHEEATKKLDLWRLPEILIVHLKRFLCNEVSMSKLETPVEFPLDLNLSNYSNLRDCYMLYAVSNHFGTINGGHYTANIRHGNQWIEFNDDRVVISEDPALSNSAYILFYKKM